MSKPDCRAQPLPLPTVTSLTLSRLAGSSPLRTRGPSTAPCAAALESAGDVPAPTQAPLSELPPPDHGKAGQKRHLWHSALWTEDGLPEQSHGPHGGLATPCLTFQDPWEARTPHPGGEPRAGKLSALRVQNGRLRRGTWALVPRLVTEHGTAHGASDDHRLAPENMSLPSPQ